MDSKIKVKNILEYFEKFNFSMHPHGATVNNLIDGPRDVFNAESNNVTFLSNKLIDTAESVVENCKASLIFLSKEIYDKVKDKNLNFSIVISNDPKKEMITCLTEFFSDKSTCYISEKSEIMNGAIIGKNVSIGAFSFIDSNVIIGDNSIVEEGVIIKNSTIGNNCIIKSNSVIGNSGFGFSKNEKGEQVEFPHFGRVLIGDSVQIGSNTCVDRGALSDTVIKDGVKVDNLVHIAHNVVIGENSLIIANSLIGGSTIIGKNCWVAPTATIKNGINIGDNCLIGMASVVTKNIESDQIIAGSPGINIQDFKKWSSFKKDIIKKM